MSAGQFKFLVDALVLFHMSFVIFVLFGGFLALWKRWAILAHLPCLAWGIHVELSHRLCPLTPLENQLRRSAGKRSTRVALLTTTSCRCSIHTG